jgi:Na+-translocating ferredoxin:NAD+ oxidoreductase RnfG subunit
MYQHIHIFPTDKMRKSFQTSTPILYAIIILVLFSFTAVVFVAYDYFVTSRQNRTQEKANKTNAIVQELFPGHVAAKLFQSGSEALESAKDAVDGMGTGQAPVTTIAELYPAATVLCKWKTIAGFGGMTSVRLRG